MDALRTTCPRGSHAQIHVAGMSMLARCLSLILTGLTLTGCRGNVDLLEARLRSQEDLLSRTQADLSQVRGELVASQSLTGRLQRQLAEATQGKLLPEQAAALFQIEGLHIDERLTAITPLQNPKSPVTLNVVVFPHDADHQAVKAPGNVELQLFGPNQQPGDEPIAHWNFGVAQVREHWHRGPIGQGFQFQVPCPSARTDDQLLLRAKFETIDGRVYEAQKTIAGGLQTNNLTDFDEAAGTDVEG